MSRARALMVLGTASHVGKSILTTAFCRLLAQTGARVAPFKAQNMALNSYVTREGGEIGRAQVAQAEAAGVEPHVDMNPVLLKPMGGVSQVVLEGSPIGTMSAREYYAAKAHIWPRVSAAYDRLAARFDLVVLEGAGSPVEINLAEHDLTNLRMARHADAAVLIVADIERGGVFAQIIGTWELLPPADRPRVVGFVINKFRGDPTLLDPGLEFVRERTGVPVLGVIPHDPDLLVDQEDSLGIDATGSPRGYPRGGAEGDAGEWLDVAVVRLPHISNFTDFAPLARVPQVRVRYVERAGELGDPDLLVLPGTKATVLDLAWVRDRGFAAAIRARAPREDGPSLLGICGGFQMLGRVIDDPLGVESGAPSVPGLDLLGVTTRFEPHKQRHRVSGTSPEGWGLTGYEIHMGETRRDPGVAPWLDLVRERDGHRVQDGAVSPDGRVRGTYVHGLFDGLALTAGFVNGLRRRKDLGPLTEADWQAHREGLAGGYDALATLVRRHVNLGPVWAALGLSLPPGDS